MRRFSVIKNKNCSLISTFPKDNNKRICDGLTDDASISETILLFDNIWNRIYLPIGRRNEDTNCFYQLSNALFVYNHLFLK
jgi:hypothetical protein